MAKAPAKKTSAKSAPAKKSNLPEREEYEYDVNTLAEDLEIEPASVRVKLRNAGIEKAGRSYGWDSKRDYDSVLKKLKNSSTRSRDEDEDGPAPKRTAKKTATKTAPAKKPARRREATAAEA
jgi:hypothetical protein